MQALHTATHFSKQIPRFFQNVMDDLKEYWEYQVEAEQKWYIIETIAQEMGLYTTFILEHVKGVTTGVEGYMLMDGKKAICFTKSIDAAIERMHEEANMDFIVYGCPID